MKSVLISIKPKWCDLILSGEKTVEVRKTKPKVEPPFKCYIYCTKDKNISFWTGKCYSYADDRSHNLFDICGSGKVIGEFVCDRVQSYYCEFTDGGCYEGISSVFVDDEGDEFAYIEWSNEGDLPYENTNLYTESCVRYDELKKYIGLGFKKNYGWHISDLKIYDKPKELSEFGMKRPPQSWCYVEEVQE